MAKKGTRDGDRKGAGRGRLRRREYERELGRLQIELCHLQEWVKTTGQRAVVVFEGRDAAGKGGAIRRITERVSPRVFRTVALPTPTEREQTQLYLQRYIAHFPAAGEVVLFDRSWYNRAGVERVMGFCTDEQYEHFLRVAPAFEREIVEEGFVLVKYFFDVSQEVQEKRFLARMTDPRRQWKLSPMDIESRRRWWDYTAAYARMLEATDTEHAPWVRVPADEKRSARLNCIADLLGRFPYEAQEFVPPDPGKRLERRAGQPEELVFRAQVRDLY